MRPKKQIPLVLTAIQYEWLQKNKATKGLSMTTQIALLIEKEMKQEVKR
jgi:hypothetical protein